MDTSRAERFFYNIFSFVFHPILLPTYLFLLVVFSAPTCRLYFLTFPVYLLIILFLQMIPNVFIPISYFKFLHSQKYQPIDRELIVFYFIMVIVSFLLLKLFVPLIIQVQLLYSFVVICLTLSILFIISFFRKISFNTTTIGVLLANFFFIAQLRTFPLTSIALLIAGITLSLYLRMGKTDAKQTIFGILVGFLSTGLSLLIIWLI